MANRKLRGVFLATLAIVLFAGDSFAENFKIDAAHSNVNFSIRHIVSRVSGGFTDFSGSLTYDSDSPEKSMVEVSIKTASINSNNEMRDNHLRSPDFFDVQNYPEITFRSTKAEKQGNMLLVTGDFTMHGVSKEVVLPVEVLGVGTHPMTKAPVAGFVAELSLLRSDYGVNSWTDIAGILGDEVKITLAIEALAQKMGPASANPCNPCNPCAKAAANPCNPCSKAAANPCNPCGKANPCNPCGKTNPCSK